MKKRLFILLFLFCAEIGICPMLYTQDTVDPLQEHFKDDEDPVLDLDDEDIISDDEDLLAILDSSIDEPSLLWIWFQTIGSSLVAHCIHIQRYMGRLFDRMRCWLRIQQEQQKSHQEKMADNYQKNS